MKLYDVLHNFYHFRTETKIVVPHMGFMQALVENYPRGSKELRGSFFDVHGPSDTMLWFSKHGVELKVSDALNGTQTTS